VVLRKKEKLLHKNAASNKIHCLNISLWGWTQFSHSVTVLNVLRMKRADLRLKRSHKRSHKRRAGYKCQVRHL
jgi:hypothetical protein